MKSILFIINPIPIYANQFKIDAVLNFFDIDYQLTFKYTQYHKHATEIAKQGVLEGYDVIVAVGGDGTIFEVAQALVFTSVSLGIIRTGYSSSFPNELNFPFDLHKSLEIIRQNNQKSIDVLRVDGNLFDTPVYSLNYIGVGISSGVVHRVPLQVHKSFKVIWLNLLKAFFDRKIYPISVQFHYETIEIEPLELLISNISQFPDRITFFQTAKLNDGVADLMFVEKIPMFRYITFLLNRILGIEDKVLRYVNYYKSDAIVLNFHKKTPIQIDNEPFHAEGKLNINVCKQVLNVLVPNVKHDCLL